MIFLLAFLGGFILNFMPCILPVVALKLMAINDSHRWYIAGIMSVFMALATLSVGLGLAWGEHFSSQPFMIGLTCTVFLMGLSYLGIWEVPTLGMRIGEVGSFGKGVVSTILGTTCSGPFLGPVFGATLRQNPVTVYAIFACIGAGMSLPYLASPLMRRVLPKPGTWMVTFKQIAGFTLVATSLWLLHSVDDKWLFPTLITMLGLGFGAWLFKWERLIGALTATAIGAVAFAATPTETIPWQPYNPYLVESDKIVMIEFTAKWCITCQVNEATLNSASVRRAVARHGVVPLRAEMPVGSQLLKSLGFNSVPVLAIFKPGQKPIVLPDLISANQVVEALR